MKQFEITDTGGFEEKVEVANVLGHPVYLTELQVSLRARGMETIGNKKLQVLDRTIIFFWKTEPSETNVTFEL